MARKRQQAEPRLGPLPEPGLVERLRASWSLAALVPAFDRRDLEKREWRSATALAVVVHLVAFAGIVVIGKLAIGQFVDQPKYSVTLVDPREYVPPEEVALPGDDAGGQKTGQPSPGETGTGSGSNTGAKPVTNGLLPRALPQPPIVPPTLPPTRNPLVVDPTVEGPRVDAPTPAQVGIPGAPEAPPSPGMDGGGGVGNHDGNGGGNGPNPGRGGGGPAGTGTGGPGDSVARTPGPGSNPFGDRPGPGIRDHGPQFITKIRPKLTQAMIDNNTSGTVTIRVTVSATGAILQAEPINTLQNGGTEAAMNALYRCRFRPAVRNGQYVTETAVVRFEVQSH